MYLKNISFSNRRNLSMSYSFINKNILTIIIVLISSIGTMQSQEGLPVYSDYLTSNYYLVHPSMAGASNCSQLRLTARRSWLGQKDAPGLQTLSYNSRINRSSAIGFNAFNDKNGFHSQSGGYATYAHHIMFSRDEVDLDMLSFGLSVGLLQYRLDQSNFVVGNDALVGNSQLNSSDLNIDFGFSYNKKDLYAHFTLKNLLKNKGINNDAQVTNNLRRYLASIGYTIERNNSNFMLEPSFLLQYREGTKQTTVDLNFKAYYKFDTRTLYGGVSFRKALNSSRFQQDDAIILEQLNYITPFVGMKFNQFHVAYTYTHQVNQNVFVQGGAQHQITLGYDFNCRKKRYHCNCPAIN